MEVQGNEETTDLKITFVSVGRKPEVWRISIPNKTSIRYIKTQIINFNSEIAKRGGGSISWVRQHYKDDDDPIFGDQDFKFFFKNMLVADVYYKKVFQWIFAAAEVTKDMIENDDIYIFEVLHNAKDEQFVFSKILRKKDIAIIPFCEFRYLSLIPKDYPDGRHTLMRKKFVDYPICGRFFNYCTSGKEIYESALSILRFFMVENGREILLHNSKGVLDLDDPKTLFHTPNRPTMEKIRENNLYMSSSYQQPETNNLQDLSEFDPEEYGGPEEPFLRIECFAEEDMYKPIERKDKIDVWYHPEHIIDISNLGSLLAGKNLYQHDLDDLKGAKQYLHVKFNIRFPQIFGIDLFDKSKLGENSFIERFNGIDLQSDIFDPDVHLRVEELKMMEFEENDHLMKIRIVGETNFVTQITTFKWLFRE